MDYVLIEQIRSDAESIFKGSLEAVDPYKAVKRFVRVEDNTLLVGSEKDEKIELDLTKYGRILVVGGGKATASMAKAIEEILGQRISKGIINVKYGFMEHLVFTEIVEAGHPVPDESGVKGTKGILELLSGAGESDLVISLISGGGSALLVHPAETITLQEKQALTQMLLGCGASIDEINAIRKHISSSKGGQMARAAYPATVVNLMLSDVVGDRIDVIASGPFTPDSSTFSHAWAVIKKYDLARDIPISIRGYLKAGLEGRVPDTPKEGDRIFHEVFNFIVGSNILALEEAEKRAREIGYKTLIFSSQVEGETRDVARVHSAIAKEIVTTGHPIPPPACIISGGETTVTIRGNGLGGRNQEFGLAAALDLDNFPGNVVILSGGSDGNDGPTDAAGAIVDPLTVRRGKTFGIEAEDYLKNNDSYHYLEKTNDLFVTGPTNTNVMDIRLILVK